MRLLIYIIKLYCNIAGLLCFFYNLKVDLIYNTFDKIQYIATFF